MHIQSYQIHNVLNVYRRQLSQVPSSEGKGCGVTEEHPDSIRISTEAKSLSIMQKVADNVIKKITAITPESEFEQALAARLASREEHLDPADSDQMFVFHTIDADNRKQTRSIAVDDFRGLMNRLNELASVAINRKAE